MLPSILNVVANDHVADLRRQADRARLLAAARRVRRARQRRTA
jgi:hypothetical protein